MSCLKRKKNMSKRVRASMYGKNSKTEPAFFSFENSGDVNRLAQYLQCEIVIYYAAGSDGRSRPEISSQFLDVYHDFRPLRTGADRNRQVLYYVLTSLGELYKLPNNVSLDKCFVAKRPCVLDDGCEWIGKLVDGCYSQSISFLLCLPRPRSGELFAPTTARLQELAHQLSDFWKQAGYAKSDVLVVAYCKNKTTKCARSQLCRRRAFSRCQYVTVALIASDSRPSTAQRADHVVMLFGESGLTKAASNHAINLKERFARLAEFDEGGSGRHGADYQGIPKVEKTKAEAAREERKKKRQKSKSKMRQADNFTKICRCELCSSSAYDDNMSKGGPERLCTVQLDVRDLLDMMGAHTPENVDLVERLSEMSLAAFDIESMTVSVDATPPESVVNYSSIDDSALGGYTKKVQKPIMIAHMDYGTARDLSDAGENSGGVITFTAESDAEYHIYKMMEVYWKTVLVRHRLLEDEKRLLAGPLIKMVEEYRRAHIACISDYAFEEGLGSTSKAYENMVKMWWHTVPGKLELALNKLIRGYTIFSFYG